MSNNCIKIDILGYDEVEHHFFPNPVVVQSDEEAAVEWQELVSEKWMQEYQEWNDFDINPKGRKGHPIFETALDVALFNKKGNTLVERLSFELKDHTNIEILPFRAIYSSMEVGDAVTAWWHIRDKNYRGFVTPIQELPISEELKARLQLWRKQIGKNWLDNSQCQCFNQEGRDLEEHLLWELNVQHSNDGNASPSVGAQKKSMYYSRQNTAESLSVDTLTILAG